MNHERRSTLPAKVKRKVNKNLTGKNKSSISLNFLCVLGATTKDTKMRYRKAY